MDKFYSLEILRCKFEFLVEKMSAKLKKASFEQKEFIINFMENNVEFSQDKFEGVDGAHCRSEKWKELSDQLNSLGGAVKDPKKWRKFWTDQRSHIKEKEALLKASFERSGVNGPQKMKPLTDFEQRVVQLMVTALVAGDDNVTELFNIEDNMAAKFLEDDDFREQICSSVNRATEEALVTSTPATPAAATTQLRKRKRNPSGLRKGSAIDERLLEIEEEKLNLKKNIYNLNKQKFEAEELFREKQFEIENRKLILEEKKFKLEEKKYSINNN